MGLFRSLVGIQYGEALLLAGDTDTSLTATTDAVLLAQKRGERGHQAYGLRLLGDILAHPDIADPDAAMSNYQKSLNLAKKLGMYPLLGRCHLGMGDLCERLDRQKDAEKHRQAASRIGRDHDMAETQKQPPDHQRD